MGHTVVPREIENNSYAEFLYFLKGREGEEGATKCSVGIVVTHNDVKQCFRGSNVHCAVVVVVTNESNMTSYFPEAGNLNGSNADISSDVAGPSRSGSGDMFELSDRSNKTYIYNSPTTNTTGRHLELERDYNSHTAFAPCYVIMHKVYCENGETLRIFRYDTEFSYVIYVG